MGEGFNDDYIYRTLKFIQSYIIFTVLPVLRPFGSTLILICKVFFYHAHFLVDSTSDWQSLCPGLGL